MCEFDALCLKPNAVYDSGKIRALRERYKIGQAELAAILHTSLSTPRQGEVGAKHPGGPSLKLLSILDRKCSEAFV